MIVSSFIIQANVITIVKSTIVNVYSIGQGSSLNSAYCNLPMLQLICRKSNDKWAKVFIEVEAGDEKEVQQKQRAVDVLVGFG